MKLADPTRPSLNSTSASTSPAGVSIVSDVVGSVGRFIPFATSVVATPIRQCPHIGTYSSCSMMMIAASACGLIGGITRTEHAARAASCQAEPEPRLR